ncbi:hypothetical protein C482_11872 [Natrialba chahannaoensis JCM 10990]|uniref:Uncharacterized protein n=1 Tax=Natrialba chahannaoensis JCM 10990 TaxID=1227492 RepID=M0AHP1_9EURY|nr:hypothetical protein [Natrialba chahannaoensis]ELY98215.1 hypothetical protein C482_11872 [Natrialba chahannaoensis JCM 10990]
MREKQITRRNAFKTGIATTVAGLGLGSVGTAVGTSTDDDEYYKKGKKLTPKEAPTTQSEAEEEIYKGGSNHEEFDCDDRVQFRDTTVATEYGINVNRTLTFLRSNWVDGFYPNDEEGHVYEFAFSSFCGDTVDQQAINSCDDSSRMGSLLPFRKEGQEMSIELVGGDLDDFENKLEVHDELMHGGTRFDDDETLVDGNEWVEDDVDQESYNVENESDFMAGMGTAFGFGSKAVSGGLAKLFGGAGLALSAGSLMVSLADNGGLEGETVGNKYTCERNPSFTGTEGWFEHFMFFRVFVPEGDDAEIHVVNEYEKDESRSTGTGHHRKSELQDEFIAQIPQNYDSETFTVYMHEQDSDVEHPSIWAW